MNERGVNHRVRPLLRPVIISTAKRFRRLFPGANIQRRRLEFVAQTVDEKIEHV